MNTTGCPPFYAVDNLFSKNTDSCRLNIVAFVLGCELVAVLHLFVAFTRLRIINHNNKRRKSRIWKWTWQSMLPYITLFHSFGSFISIALTPLVWYFYNPSGGFMVTFQLMFLFIATELWISKMIRLGTRIIPKSNSSIDESLSVTTHLKSEKATVVDNLSHPDVILRLFTGLDACLMGTQFVCGTIVYGITSGLIYVRIVLGTMGVISASWAAAVNWQYRRCENAIRIAERNVGALMPADDKRRADQVTQSVLRKMRMQRLMLSIFGICGALLLLLFTTDVIPIEWWLVFVLQGFNATPQSLLVFSMLLKTRSSAKTQPPMPSRSGNSKDDPISMSTKAHALVTQGSPSDINPSL